MGFAVQIHPSTATEGDCFLKIWIIPVSPSSVPINKSTPTAYLLRFLLCQIILCLELYICPSFKMFCCCYFGLSRRSGVLDFSLLSYLSLFILVSTSIRTNSAYFQSLMILYTNFSIYRFFISAFDQIWSVLGDER